MKVLVTGANGQLGQDVVSEFKISGCEVYAYGRDELDITSLEQCLHQVGKVQPEVIIHCAAYTAVDQAESEEDQAYLVNAVGTRNLVVAAEKISAKFCYISTDYVFDGEASVPYKEYDNTNPVGVYGKSKRAGELLVQSLSSRYFIVRTSWVFGIHGNNFVKTMIRLGQERQQQKLMVVHDQMGSPTFTEDLAYFLLELTRTEKYGVYHASNGSTCTWFEFAKAIFDAKGMNVNLVPCTTQDFPRPAPRPKFSVMDNLGIRINGFEPLRHWNDALTDFIEKLDKHQ